MKILLRKLLLVGGNNLFDENIILVEDIERKGVYLVGKGICILYVVVILEAYVVVDLAIALVLEDMASRTRYECQHYRHHRQCRHPLSEYLRSFHLMFSFVFYIRGRQGYDDPLKYQLLWLNINLLVNQSPSKDINLCRYE